MSGLRVVRTGALMTCQDLGRRGVAHWGVARSGAADRGALRLANRLVGNDEGAAGLEILAGSATLQALGDIVVSVTGAVTEVRIGCRVEGRNVALCLTDGEHIELGRVTRGLRCYIGVRGGVAVPMVLGSRSRDQLGELGPAPLQVGDVVHCGDDAAPAVHWEVAPMAEVPIAPELRVIAGPRDDWLEDSLDALLTTIWRVSNEVDRTGVRLIGDTLRRRPGELPSEGVVPGAIQVPADGQPIVLGPDAGVTGGYPTVAVVVNKDLDLVGQLAPGMTVHLRRIA